MNLISSFLERTGKIFAVILIFIVGCSLPSLAQQNSNVWFRNLGLEDGLPTKKINDITQGPEGFLWLATLDGLVRYDGYAFKSYRVPAKNGFPVGNSSDRLVKAPDGKIWVSYWYNSYISYYDTKTHQFNSINLQDKISLNSDVEVTRLLGVDHQNNIWASIITSGDQDHSIIIKISGTDRSIQTFKPQNGYQALKGATVPAFYFARHVAYNAFYAADDGSVWIGANDRLINITKDNSVTTFTGKNPGFTNAGVRDILNRGKKLWIATDKGIRSYHKKTQQFKQVEGPDSLQQNPVAHLYKDQTGIIWITTPNRTYRYNPSKQSFSLIDDPKLLSGLKDAALLPQAENERYIWFINNRVYDAALPSTNGVTRYDKRTHLFQTFNSNDITGLGNIYYITRIFRDNSGSIWIGNNFSGLSQYPPLFKKFDTHFRADLFKNKVGNSFYYRVRISPEGHYFVGTGNGKIFAKNIYTGEEKVIIEFKNPVSSGGRNLIGDMMFQGRGTLIVASQMTGLVRISYNPQTLEVTETKIWSGTKVGVDRVLNLTKDNNGTLWVGGGMGLAKANLKAGTFKPYHAVSKFKPLYDFGISTTKDTHGFLWFYGFYYNALKRFDPKTKKLKIYNAKGTVPDDWAFSLVEHIHETPSGEMYAAANNNIYRLNEVKDRFEPILAQDLPEPVDIEQTQPGKLIVVTYSHGIFWIDLDSKQITKRLSRQDGLASNINDDLIIDSNGMFWFINPLGLSQYNPKTDQIINYYKDQGLSASKSEIGYQFFTTDSTTYFPIWIGNQGIASFQPANIPTNTYSHTPVFTSVKANGQSLSISGDIELSHNQNSISFGYSNLAYQYPEKSEYRYSINNGNWTDWQKSHQASFAQLAPGHYTFRVQARNADRVVAPQTASYTFTIAPPWYQSSISYFLYLIFGIGGLAYTTFWYSNYRTEQKAIRMRAKQVEELAKLDRIKTNLLTNISHELRTPLTLILGPIEQLRDKAGELGEDWKRRLDIARRNGKRLRQLVEQVLDLTRLDAKQLELEPANIEITPFLRRLSESFESMAYQHKVTIETDFVDDPIKLQADPDKLEKAMVNLLSNAIKFTPADGTVTISTKTTAENATITIADTGRGISSDRLPHIFDRFHSTGEAISGGGKGLGVGLAITKEFIELHKGTISVESEEGSGTAFTITLPQKAHDSALDHHALDEESYEETETVTANSQLVRSLNLDDDPFTVLVVEDNEDMRTYISDLLNNENLLVETAPNGLDAKKRLSIIDPDLIISDIMMPEMDGFAFIKHVRSNPQYRLTPIVMLSARAEVEDRIHGYEIGVSDYLVKPFDETELKAQVSNLLHRKAEREKLAKENGQETSPNEKSSLIKTLQDFVEANLSDSKITVEQLSEEANLSRRQLYRNLKAETGCTPAEFIREIRLYNARDILKSNQKQTVSEVSYKVGFSTPSYFSKLFKERFGRSPSMYKN